MAARPATRRPMGRPADLPQRRDRPRPDPGRRLVPDRLGRPARRTTSSSRCPATPARPTTCRRPIGRWLTETRKALAPRTSRPAIATLFESELAIHAGVLLVDQPDVRTSADFVGLVEATDADGPRRARSSPTTATTPSSADLDRSGDRRRPGGAAGSRARSCRTGTGRAGSSCSATRPSPRSGSCRCSGRGRRRSPRSRRGSRAILERDYDGRAADRERLAPAELIETTTGGVRYLPEPGISRVILGPSYFSRPYNFLMSARDWRFFGYPGRRQRAGPVRRPDPAAVARPAPSGARRRDAAADPEAARLARPLPDRDRAAARPLQTDDQAPHDPAPLRRTRDDHRLGHGHVLQPPPQPPRRRVGGDQAVPRRLAGPPGQPRAAAERRGPSFGADELDDHRTR